MINSCPDFIFSRYRLYNSLMSFSTCAKGQWNCYSRPRMTRKPQNMSKIIGQTAQLSCGVAGNPQPTITWEVPKGASHHVGKYNLKFTSVHITLTLLFTSDKRFRKIVDSQFKCNYKRRWDIQMQSTFTRNRMGASSVFEIRSYRISNDYITARRACNKRVSVTKFSCENLSSPNIIVALYKFHCNALSTIFLSVILKVQSYRREDLYTSDTF